jgi:hypothetical protein
VVAQRDGNFGTKKAETRSDLLPTNKVCPPLNKTSVD